MYYTLYNLLLEHLYGIDVVLTGSQEITLTLISTIGALFIVAIPFMVVWRLLKVFI